MYPKAMNILRPSRQAVPERPRAVAPGTRLEGFKWLGLRVNISQPLKAPRPAVKKIERPNPMGPELIWERRPAKSASN
jgi:hypothetical protein